MKPSKQTQTDTPRQKTTIRLKTAMLSWLVTIVTITVFAFYMIPQQKKIFLDELESKARMLASSIHDITASAIVTEDYSEVVDHCMEILQSNESVRYIVLTRNDGFSLVHTPRGWGTEQMEGDWISGWKAGLSGSQASSDDPLGVEAFHYDETFSYSGIDWGRVHIGLSLDHYHAVVKDIFLRTGIILLLCALLGLAVSLFYATRLVKPILILKEAVRRVTQGDLGIRANVTSGDEVESLAHAFNQMAQSIQDREAFVRRRNNRLAGLATEKTLHEGNLHEAARKVAAVSAETLEADCVSIWLFNEKRTVLECTARFLRASGTHRPGGELPRKGSEPFFEALESDRVLAADNTAEDPRLSCLAEAYLRPNNVASLLDSAIRVGGQVVGVVCHEQIGQPRSWSAEDENFAGSVADLMALALEARDRRLSQDELVQAKEEAEAASKAKSRFLANMSHEIRTPLNGVVGMLKLLRGGPLNTKQQRFVSKGILSSEALLVVINDVLDFSKIEAGKMEIENLPFNLVDVIENVTQMFAQRAEEKGLELASFIHNDVPVMVCGDANRLGQVLINLASNAIKFTERGEVIIHVRLESRDDQQCVVLLEVKDTGIGISLKEKERIFEAFLQEDSSTTRRFGGTGLGLGISRQLVELMGGRIQVESKAGYGSTFLFTVNLGISKGVYKEPDRRNGMRGLDVLVVDDHAVNREILCYELNTWGCKTAEAENGNAALELMRQRAAEGGAFDLAIIDWDMPGISGEELGRRIKADPQLADTKMVMLSSVNEINSDRLRDVGFSAYLSKPARQSEMYDAIMNSINNVPEALSNMEPARTREAIPDCSDMRILLAEDNEINQEVAIEILKMSGYSCDVVSNGRKALEAVASGEYDLLFMDCMMPEMDGYEATRCIREEEKDSDRHLPIVALTANAMKGDRERCLECGMDDYLSKPLDPEETVAMVEKWHVPEVVPERAAFMQEGDPGTALFDRETLLKRCMGNEALVEKLIAKFMNQVGDDLRKLGAGLSNNNFEEVLHAAHRIKGASANLTMESLRRIAAEIEGCARGQDISGASTGFRDLSTEVLRVRQFFESRQLAGQEA